MPTDDDTYPMLADDISLEPIEAEMCGYQDCERPVTHYLIVDFRTLGLSQAVESFCYECGLEAMARLKAALPAVVVSENEGSNRQ